MGDWDREPIKTPGVFMRLKTKGESIKMRIVASPYREMKVWPAGGGKPLDSQQLKDFTPGQWLKIMMDPDWEPREAWYLIGINRATNEPVILTVSGGVYSAIGKFATDPEWGDPRGYDVTITRTEAPGPSYYEVKASPNKTALTKGEYEKVNKMDLAEKIPGAHKASEPQPDDWPVGTRPENLPWEGKALPAHNSMEDLNKPTVAADELVPNDDPDDIPVEDRDKVISFDDGDPINLDDIPF